MKEGFFESPGYSAEELKKDDPFIYANTEQDSLTKVIGTGVDTIKIIKNFMTQEDIEVIMRKVNNMYGIKKTTRPYLELADSKILEYLEKIRTNAEKFFDVELDYDEYASPSDQPDSYLAGRKKDFVTSVHTDILDIDKQKYEKYLWSGHLSNLIYLNDNYDGGELYFPHHDLKIKPEPGMLISFPGNWWNRHGILPASDIRFAVSVFFKIKNFE
jgi:hypothetical protein